MADSPFANTTEQSPNPWFLRQNNNNGGSWAGGISNMVKALVSGNNQYMDRQKTGGMAPSAEAPAQPPGEPLSLAPPTPTPTPDVAPPSSAVNIPPLPQPRPDMAPPMPSSTMGGPMSPEHSMPLWQANAGGAPPMGASPMMKSPPNLPWMPANGTLASNGSSSKVPGLPNGTDPTIQALLGGFRG